MTLTFEDSGKRGAPILFFIHGWPDTKYLWRHQVAFFAHEYRCVCVTLPGYETAGPYWGHDFPELVTMLAEVLMKVKSDSSNQDMTIVGHDWGAYLCYLLDQSHPELSNRIITMDVGAHFKASSFAHGVFMLSYQGWLVAAFLVGSVMRPLGNAMTRALSNLFRTPRREKVEARMNYMYFYMWRGLLLKHYRKRHLAKYKIEKPLLYLFGASKKFHFHSDRWVQMVNAAPGSEAVGLEGMSHWFMLQARDQTNELMGRWLKQPR